MVAFKDRADEYIWRKYRIEVEHLCAMRNGEKLTYEKMFYHVPNRKPSSSAGGTARNKGQFLDSRHYGGLGVKKVLNLDGHIKGWPLMKGPWCQTLKTRFLGSPRTRGGKNIVEYIGIAADEPKRFGQLSDWKRAPLVEFGIEEDLCGLYCQYEGILGPSYETGCRDGCWFCHNQGVKQLRLLRRNYPDLWQLLLKWDADSPVSFKPDGRSVHDYDLRFQAEDEGIIRLDEPFRWCTVFEPQLRWF